MKKLPFLALLTLLPFLASAAPSLAGPVKIGLLAPLTGPFASEGQDMKNLVSLLAEELNRAGGVNGSPVEVVVEDDGSAPRSAANAANRLVARGVPVVVGTYGSAVTEASQEIFAEAGIVQIATGSTAIRLTAKGLERFFRTCPRDDEQGRVAAETIARLGFRNIAILHDNSVYAKGLAEESRERIRRKGVANVIFYDALQPNERDYSAILTKLKGIGPEAILFTGYYTEAGLLLRQMAEMRWSVPMIGGDATNNVGLVEIAGKAATGYRFISPALPADIDTPAARAFLAAYQAEYKTLPGSIWPVLAGDAFNVLVEAIKARGTDPGAIAGYLHKELRDFEGLTGKISFDYSGDRVGDLYRLYEVDAEGRFVLVP
ncbi:MAG: branched-chain amino acid ABC transporter substrate-binding protein [Desulfovibrio sp.]|jgi:branched-chain amino acid transport system substrate-binding protein|nr:branched-chain amino acid ABC transporter substrate-binding protein [Desulfovibrio sp.]